MRRFLQRQQPDCARDRATRFALAIALLATCLSGLAREARAQDEQLSKIGQADHPIVVSEHAGWNMDCEAIAPPTLHLYEPPRHGRVCARVEDIKVRAMYAGTESQCIGRLVRGIALIYRPNQGYTGNDGLRYAAQYPSGLRMVAVALTVTAFSEGAPGMVASNLPAPMPPQSPAPVPGCDELVF